MQNNNKRDYN